MSEPNHDFRSPRFSPAAFLVLAAIQMEGGLALLALLIAWWFNFSLTDQIRWCQTDFLLGTVATLPPLFLCWGIYRLRWKNVEFIRRFLSTFHRDFIRHCSLLQLFLISLLAGIGEELFFRGLVQSGMTVWLTGLGMSGWQAVVWGIFVSSLLFGLVHPISRLYVMICFLIGIYCGLLLFWTGNLLVPMTMHAIYDFLVLVFWRRIAGQPPDP